jgi:hypothetical protein
VAGEAAFPLSLPLSGSFLATLRAGRGRGSNHETAVGVFGALLAWPGHTGPGRRGLVVGRVEDGGCVRCGFWGAGAESAVGKVFVLFFAFTATDDGRLGCAASLFWRNEEALTTILVLAARGIVTAVGAEETTLSHGSEQYADNPPLNIAERSWESHARLCVLKQVSGESDGGVPEVAEQTAEAVD